MARYIDADKVEELIKNYGKGAISDGLKALDPVDDIVMLVKGIDLIPTADVAEVKHGKWVDRYGSKYGNRLYECSECGEEALYDVKADELDSIKIRQVLSAICPYCGALMDGEPIHNVVD